MEEYKPNSHKSKETRRGQLPEKKIEKVIAGSAKIKKKSEAQKMMDVFISEDAGNVKSYVFLDVLVPAIKKLITDVVKNGIDMIFYGGASPNRKESKVSRFSYGKCYDEPARRSYNRPKNDYDYGNVYLESRGEAEEVLYRMDELIATYGIASVADLYDLVGADSDYTDNNYGWTDIQSATIVRTRNGDYMIKMPKAFPLD